MKSALITGGPGGIGSAICRALAADGWFVNLVYHQNREGAEALAQELHGRAFCANIGEEQETEQLFSAVGAVDLLVLNAGVSYYGLLTDMSYGDWRALMSVNLDGAFLCCRHAIPPMVRKQAGNIIFISSMWGQVGASCEVAYSASKAALCGMTKALSKELAPSGIRVNCVAPGVIQTAMLRSFNAEELEELRQETPLERLGQPEDVANAVRFLASEQSSFITGQILGVNGGFVIT